MPPETPQELDKNPAEVPQDCHKRPQNGAKSPEMRASFAH
jgi:hypothetical protein